MPKDEENFKIFTFPDISNVDQKKITKFATTAPKWRQIGEGLNLESMCLNKDCKQAYKHLVWTKLGFGTFHMQEIVRKCPCPMCGKPTKRNKKIGIYKCILNGKGMKVPKKISVLNKSQMSTQADSGSGQDTDDDQQTGQEKFPQIKVASTDGFLKMDGVNGKMVEWYYMVLEITKITN